MATSYPGLAGNPTEQSPQTQINNVYGMMWPNSNDAEVDVFMQGGLWRDVFPEMAATEQQHSGVPGNPIQFPSGLT
jgi:transcriptional regulatory protein GAL4